MKFLCFLFLKRLDVLVRTNCVLVLTVASLHVQHQVSTYGYKAYLLSSYSLPAADKKQGMSAVAPVQLETVTCQFGAQTVAAASVTFAVFSSLRLSESADCRSEQSALNPVTMSRVIST